MKVKKLVCLLLTGTLALSVLTGCGSSRESEEVSQTDAAEKEELSENSTEDTAPSEDSAYPMTFDNYGREVTIDKKPEKVLTLGPNCTELFAALGLEDYVVGRSLINHSRGPLDEFADAVNAVPELNNGPATREAILSSGADFIYALDWEISEDGCNIEEVKDYGMTVYVNSATSLEEMYQEILDIGKIFGVEDKAEAYVADQKTRIQTVQDTVAGQEPVDVLVYDSGNDGVFTCSGTNFESLLVGYAGGKNLFNDLDEKQWVTVSYEEVLARDPDVILIHDYDSPSVEEKIQEIKTNPTLSQLDCVKNERFAVITLESVLAGNRMAYAVESMAADFYPELFTE
ncbi:MAG: ABC transporter substrate-binding protein [Clostridiales bacterium]|nr:ABC transporter substrate-binding protein [Clostridiales bacterium]